MRIPRLDSQLMDGAVGQRACERLVDTAVLLDERQADERRRGDGDLEMVSPARAVDHVELGRVGKRACQQLA